MRLRLFTAISITAVSLLAADPELMSLAPPDTQVMAGVNAEQVMLSPLARYILTQAQQSDAEMQKLVDSMGFDIRHDLREILVASSGQHGANSGIILARGTFNVAKIVQAATADNQKVETYKGAQLIVWKGKQEELLAFLGSDLALVGDPASVRAAIDRKSAPTAISSALAVAVNQASTTQDAWFVSMVPPSQLQPDAKGAGPFAILNNILQASGGIKFGANVVISLQAVSATAQDATALADVVKSFVGMASMAGGKDQSAAPFLAIMHGLEVSADGTSTKLSLSIPEQQIEELINAHHSADGAIGLAIHP